MDASLFTFVADIVHFADLLIYLDPFEADCSSDCSSVSELDDAL